MPLQPTPPVKKKSTSRSAFLNLCVLLGLLAFIAGALLAVFAAPALGQIRRGEANPKAVIDTSAGKIGNNIVAGVAGSGSCQYTIAYTTNIIVPGNTDTGNHCAWCDTTINLPFPFVLYDQTFSAVMVNSSGRLDFVCNTGGKYNPGTDSWTATSIINAPSERAALPQSGPVTR